MADRNSELNVKPDMGPSIGPSNALFEVSVSDLYFIQDGNILVKVPRLNYLDNEIIIAYEVETGTPWLTTMNSLRNLTVAEKILYAKG